MASVRSYLSYYDIDVIPSKFKRKVKMPKMYREDEEAIDAKDIREILLKCTNRRLKTYLLVLASGGMRAEEGLAIRLKDIDFSALPEFISERNIQRPKLQETSTSQMRQLNILKNGQIGNIETDEKKG
jgi:integrase